ncbi:hypothetical protein DL96DRAFT_1473897 [Flagelloscypha sp. PMI_526]|nr:hypothetical protein DL96DRAFT_1473897 [Flagelloscypha sp. PMI_526]
MHHGGHHSFAQRIQSALMALGPWEGRAVAFVLGCGIGVLLRMVFVMVILSYRAIKGSSRKEEEDESEVQYAVIYEYQDDAEEIAVPPPNYNLPCR